MTIAIEGFIGKLIYKNEDFKIYSFYPTKETINNVKVNEKYSNISISGTLPTLLEKVKYKLEVEEIIGKYPNSYSVSKLSSDTPKDSEFKDKFLQSVVSSKQYITLKEVYPDIVDMIINDEPIDVRKLHGIGEKSLSKIKDKVKKDYSLLDLVGKYSDLGMTMNGLKKLKDTYKSTEMIDEKMANDPYKTLVGIAGIGFKKADACLLKKYPSLIDSEERCRACISFLIKQNEQKGNTWISMPNLYRLLMEYSPESAKHFDLIVKGDDFFYHPESNRISLKSTYICEREVCNRLLKYKERHDILDINWEDFGSVDGFPLTEQQKQILKNVCRENLNLLVGYGGCVDGDTEYFNGNRWIKIRDYKEGDKVLQFNSKDKSANLVIPKEYIKEQCDYLWHFKTEHGLDQCLSNEHKVVYETTKGEIDTIPFYKVKELHENTKLGFDGKFLTTFNYNGEGIDLTDDEIRIMCAIICDGSFSNKQLEYVVSIKDKKRIERIEELLKVANIDFKACRNENYNKYVFNILKKDKDLDTWYSCSNKQLQIICDEILNWNCFINRDKIEFSNVSEEIVDFMQFVFSSCGYNAIKRINCKVGQSQKSISFNLTITQNNKLDMLYNEEKSIEKAKIKQYRSSDGYKYCFVVPSDMLILRRSGKVFITGNCGKTFSTKALVEMLEANMMTYLLVSPTGRASKVFSDNTGRNATTIHRALDYKQGKGFQYNLENKLPNDVVIIDEYSMIDIFLLRDLLRAIRDDAKIVFIGDPDQIPSVGCGNTAFDMLMSQEITTSLLTQVFRYGEGGLSYVATQIREGKYYLPSQEQIQSFGKNKDYTFVNTTQTIPVVKSLYNKLMTQKEAQPSDIMVLTSYNKGEFGTINLNKIIQSMVNPENGNKKQITITKDGEEITFREGDKVMQTINDYKTKTVEGREHPVMNGDIGNIISIEDDTVDVAYDNAIIQYNKESLLKLALAYSISIHKCVTGDTLIYTNKGIKQIKELDNGALIGEQKAFDEDIKVFDGDKLEKPTYFYNAGLGECKEIKTKCGYNLKATLDHKISIMNEEGILEQTLVEDLKVGDYVGIRINQNVYGNDLDLNKYIDSNYDLDVRSVHYNIPKTITKDLCRFIGFMLADGCITKSGIRYSKNQKEVVEKWNETVYNLFGYECTSKNIIPDGVMGGMYLSEVSSMHIREFCLKLGGLTPNDKYIPDFILNTTKENQIEFLKGIFEDGTVGLKKGKFDNIELSLYEKSYDILNKIRMMLLNMGIVSSIHKYTKGDNTQYRLNIYKKYAILFNKLVGFYSYNKQSRLDNLGEYDIKSSSHIYIPNINNILINIFKDNNIKPIQFSKRLHEGLKQDNFLITDKMLERLFIFFDNKKINNKDIEYLKYIYSNFYFDNIEQINDCYEQTYCLTMPIKHEFIQNGFVGSNCQGSQSKYVILVTPEAHTFFLNRNLLYVGVSRAKELVYHIGTTKLIRNAVRKSENFKRDTYLLEMLQDRI